MEKEKKMSFHKVFNIISIVFLLSCIIGYGTRFTLLYMDNNKKEEANMIGDNIKDNNSSSKNFKNIKGDYYFTDSEANNYIKYSNFLWRIIKVDKKGNVVIALDNSVTSLARGNVEFKDSNIYNWLNNKGDDTGIFENVLNDTPKYLTYNEVCSDDVDDTKKITCKDKIGKTYVSIPTLNDYVNTGSSKSSLNSGGYYYLLNKGSKNVWCVDEDGKVSTSDGNDIIGIKPVVTIKNTTKLVAGDGSLENPYVFEEEIPSLLGSIVKLGDDLWQIYDISGDNYKLALIGYLKVNGKEVTNKYSKFGFEYNTNEYGSLANYLNNRYLNSLSYKNVLEDFDLVNGSYESKNYMESFKTKVSVKVGILSIGDMILNQSLTDYYMASGEGSSVYVFEGSSRIGSKQSSTMLNIVPTISIKKSLIVEYGTVEVPYEVKYE